MSDDDYGFEYSDDDQEEEDVNIENRYYNAKGDLAEDVDAALSGFKEVVSMEEEKGEWGFKVRARRLFCSAAAANTHCACACMCVCACAGVRLAARRPTSRW